MVSAAMAAATVALVAMVAVSEAMVAEEEGMAVGRGGSSLSHACGLQNYWRPVDGKQRVPGRRRGKGLKGWWSMAMRRWSSARIGTRG
jgi:hypothetical protein